MRTLLRMSAFGLAWLAGSLVFRVTAYHLGLGVAIQNAGMLFHLDYHHLVVPLLLSIVARGRIGTAIWWLGSIGYVVRLLMIKHTAMMASADRIMGPGHNMSNLLYGKAGFALLILAGALAAGTFSSRLLLIKGKQRRSHRAAKHVDGRLEL